MNITSLQIGENTLEVPGKWVNKNYDIAQFVVVTKNTQYSLKNYLPDDDYVYEVQFDGWLENRTRVIVYSDITEGIFMNLLYDVANLNNATGSVGGNITITVGKNRIVGLVGAAEQIGRIGLFRARRYRRLYKTKE